MSNNPFSAGGWSTTTDRDTQPQDLNWRDTYLHAYSLVRNRADAEDLAQEACLRLFQRSKVRPKIESYVNWMRVVVRNAMRHCFARTRPDLHVPILDEKNDDLVDRARSVEEKVIQENLATETVRLIAKLPAMEKECVMMYARGYTFAQIAHALGMPYRDVIKTTTKAVVKIRSTINKVPQRARSVL